LASGRGVDDDGALGGPAAHTRTLPASASAQAGRQHAGRTMTSPVQPRPTRVGYSGTPLAKKLGIREASTVALVGASLEFTIPDLPPGVGLRRSARGQTDVTLWFVRSATELAARVADMAKRADKNALWICWPKRTSGVRTDVTERAVRTAGLANGLVDFKIVAIDETWSGLRFAAVSRGPDRTRTARGAIPSPKPAP